MQFRYPVAQFQQSHHSASTAPNTGSSGSSNSHAGPLSHHAVSVSSTVHSSGLFDEDPGIMSEADTSSTSGRKRRQLKAEAQKYHHQITTTGSVILCFSFVNSSCVGLG